MTEPVFNFNVPDWTYLASYHCILEAPFGEIDVHALIWKDGIIKAKIRCKFPSGNKLTSEFECETYEKCIDKIDKVMSEFPEATVVGRAIIENPGKTGQDLFNAIYHSPLVKVSSIVMEENQ